jgi:protein subunit release factor B
MTLGKDWSEPKIKYTVPRSDLRLEFFRAGGKGGQKQNKTSSACRITHVPSGAVGESREERSQTQNRKIALERLAANRKFRGWCALQLSAMEQGFKNIEAKVARDMVESNLKIELGVGCVPGETVCDRDGGSR